VAGFPCDEDLQCADAGAVCASDTLCGRCVVGSPVGGACDFDGGYCAGGLACVVPPGEDPFAVGTCVATELVGAGDTCGAQFACGQDLLCRGGICVSVDSCDPTITNRTLCGTGRTCSQAGTCVAATVAAVGAACDANGARWCIDQTTANFCKDQRDGPDVCTPRQAIGASCSQASPCVDGSSCTTGVCVAREPSSCVED